jgi:hypothetical protein
MTIQYLNVSVGTALANGDIPTVHKGGGTAQVGHVSLAWDDATVTKQSQLLAGLRALQQSVLAGGTTLTKG